MLPPVLPLGTTVLANVYTCEAIQQGKPNCAKPATDFIVCAFSACETCSTTPDQDACINTASTPGGVCADNITIPVGCDTVLNAPSFAPVCTNNAANPTFLDLYTGASNVICGP